jgi:predicted secreted protein
VTGQEEEDAVDEAWRRSSFRIVAMLAEENAGGFRCVERRSTGHRHRPGTSRESCTAASMLRSSSKKTREESGGGGRE